MPPPIRFGRNAMGWIVFALLAAMLLTVYWEQRSRRDEMLPRDLWTYAENNEIKTLVIKSDRIDGELVKGVEGRGDKSPKFYVLVNFDTDKTFVDRLIKVLEGKQTKWKWDEPPGWFTQFLPTVLLSVVLMALVWFVLIRRVGQGGGPGGFLGGFGRSRHRVTNKEHTNVTFDDIAGIEEAKEEVSEIIEFLKNPRKFRRLGGRIPRGVLLVGEPGCGKTLLAKGIAGEADVPFFSISGSDFVEMYVGVGASRVRDLFQSAKQSSPCIIFLDEIDAVGRRRGSDPHGSSQETAQTLNAILVEMDGFETDDQVIVIAATNRMDVLDPALTRPGRFDRQIHVPLPDVKGRYQILQIYAGKVKCGPDVDLQRMARGTPMFSGADLAALINEAAIAATMANKDCVEMADLEEARDKVRWGRARKSRAIDEREKEMTAYHEAGHALVQVLTPDADPLHKVSLIPRGNMGGATFSLPEKDRYMYTRRWCEAFIRVCMAGRISEEMFCGDVDSGAASDITQATEIARAMVMDWGMSQKLGFVRYAPTEAMRTNFADLVRKEYSDRTAEVIDEEVKAIMEAAETETRQLLQANRDKVRAIAQALLKYETLSAEEVDRILAGEQLDRPSMNELLDKELAKNAQPAAPSPLPGTPDPQAGAGRPEPVA